MTILQNHPLRQLNTFGIDAHARQFAIAESEADIRDLLNRNIKPLKILGGGSNILLTGDLEGLSIKIEIGGIETVRVDGEAVFVKAGAGVIWNDLVFWCLDKGYAGIENLVLIPGTVGAAPIQNIGAYGVELKDVFWKLQAIEISSGIEKTFHPADCQFDYRHSIFKTKLKGKFIITQVYLKLSTLPTVFVDYGDIHSTLNQMKIKEPGIREVAEAVMKIRRSKLPNPSVLGNAGSFFKNPELSLGQFKELSNKFPEMPHYQVSEDSYKIPAGWLIEKAGWKGKRYGNAGCHERQALVLANYGNATGQEILDLSRAIQGDIFKTFGIELEPEVNIW